MKSIVMCLAIFVVLVSGCTGSFNVTKNIHKFHRTQENKWVDEAIFLGCALLPVYGLGMLGDAVIFNTVEFWSGKNPIKVSMSNSPDKDVILERSAEGVVAKDKFGSLLYTSTKDSEGGVSVYDGDKMLVRYFSPEEVQSKKSHFPMNFGKN